MKARLSVHSWCRLSAALVLMLALSACGSLLQTDYVGPKVQVPGQWVQASAQSLASGGWTGGVWWKNFQDPTLDQLIDAALSSNNDLAAAAIRVRRAQLQAGLAQHQRMPVLGGDASLNRSRTLRGSPRSTVKTNAAELTVQYELDLWGRLSRLSDAAQWEAQATEQDQRSAALSLVGATANLYWQTGFINQRLASSLASIAYARQTLDLVQTQYAAGAVSALEVAEAGQRVASQQAAHTLLVQQRVEYLNAMAILFNGPPERIMADPASLPQAPLPEAQAGTPAQLLLRRPDLNAAELRLRAAWSNVDAARASYYPPLILTGSLGGASATLGNVLQNPVAALGAGLTLPFLQWQQMRLSIKVSETEFEERVAQFRQAWYQALAEVENTLSARRQYALQGESLERSLLAAREAERLYEVRYRAGSVALRFWLDAQEQRRAAQIARDENYLNQLLNQVKVYQALGGDDRLSAEPGAAWENIRHD